MQVEAARIFSELSASLEERERFYKKLISLHQYELSKPLIKSISTER